MRSKELHCTHSRLNMSMLFPILLHKLLYYPSVQCGKGMGICTDTSLCMWRSFVENQHGWCPSNRKWHLLLRWRCVPPTLLRKRDLMKYVCNACKSLFEFHVFYVATPRLREIKNLLLCCLIYFAIELLCLLNKQTRNNKKCLIVKTNGSH